MRSWSILLTWEGVSRKFLDPEHCWSHTLASASCLRIHRLVLSQQPSYIRAGGHTALARDWTFRHSHCLLRISTWTMMAPFLWTCSPGRICLVLVFGSNWGSLWDLCPPFLQYESRLPSWVRMLLVLGLGCINQYWPVAVEDESRAETVAGFHLWPIFEDCVLVLVRSRSWHFIGFGSSSFLFPEIVSPLLHGYMRLVLVLAWPWKSLAFEALLASHAESSSSYLKEGDLSFPYEYSGEYWPGPTFSLESERSCFPRIEKLGFF